MISEIILSLIYIIVILFLITFLFSQFWIDLSNSKLKGKFGLPYVPTPKKRLRIIIDMANLKPEDKVIDLGSGDGRLVIAAAQKGTTAIGYELNPALVLYSRLKIKLLNIPNAKIYRKNLFDADFTQYNVFLLYTMPWVMDEIINRLKNSTYDKIRVVSNTFQFGDIEPIKKDLKNKVFLYEITKNEKN